MADEQQQDRTEQATPKRREDARKKGDVPRSRELTMTGVMLAGSTALLFLAGPMSTTLVGGFKQSLSIERALMFDSSLLPAAFASAALDALLGLLPFAAVLLAAVFASATLIGGWSFSVKAFAFKGERMSPIKGLKRIFSLNSVNELVKAIGKFALVGLIAVLWLWWSIDELLALGRQPVGAAIQTALEICGVSLLVVSTGLIVIAMIDVPFQLHSYRKKLKMTRTEVRDEFKETEGRPEVKGRIRQLQRQAAQRRMMADIPTADVVITNPTHFAIALKYDDEGNGAPRVVAKGKGLIAAKIREIATHHRVPLFSAPPLARALYRSTELGQEIPAALYTAVAQVLAYIFQIRDAALPPHQWPTRPTPDVDESQF
ncbi:MAG: flagellar biosynthesis protein FlhB [Woeseia sp.]|nr:flagellar biosynthesis protein FlhB [Woeseia sp.]